jgi:hypothetical protein
MPMPYRATLPVRSKRGAVHPHRTLKEFEKEKYCFTRTTHQKWPGTAQKTGIEADVINAINSISLHLGTAPPQLLLAAGLFLSAQLLRQLGDGVRQLVPRLARPMAVGSGVCDHW